MPGFIEQNSQRLPLEDIIPLEFPVGLCIEPINICNFKCKFCPISLPEFKKIVPVRKKMELSLYKKIINEIKDNGHFIQKLNLYGDGEPLLNTDIYEMISLGKEVAYPVVVTTNASLLDTKNAEKLVQSQLDYLRVSIYSVRSSKHRALTKSKVDPAVIRDNIIRLKEIRGTGTKPHIYVKMLNTYDDEVDEFISMYRDIADEVNIETPMNWNGFNGHDLIKEIDPEKKTDETKVQGFYASKDTSGYKEICTIPFHSLNIKSNGDVCVCIVDWNRGTKVGNLYNNSLKEIWDGEKLNHLRRLHIERKRDLNPSCKNCRNLYCNPDNIDHIPKKDLFRMYGIYDS